MAPGLLLFIFLQAAPVADAMELVPQGRDVGAPGFVLDLAFLDDQRLLALTEHALLLYRIEDVTPALEARLELPGARLAVRAPAGLLRASEAERVCWLITNGRARASLVAVEGRGLAVRLEAEAVPWAGSATGLRYRAGTNLLLLGESPFLAMREGGLAVAPDGRLAVDGRSPAQGRRVGAALDRLGSLIVASSSRPPGATDSLELIPLEGELTGLAAQVKIDGSISALAARDRRREPLVVAAIQGRDGVTRLVSYAVRPRP